MAVVGVAGSVWGAVLGSGLILVLKDQIQNVLPRILHTTANFELIAFGVLMILVLQYARDGVWPILSQWWSVRSEEHTSELQSLMRISYAVFCLKKKKKTTKK